MFERSNELNIMHIENNIGLLKSLRNEFFTENNIIYLKTLFMFEIIISVCCSALYCVCEGKKPWERG